MKKIFSVLPVLLSSQLFGQQKPNVLFIAIDDLNDWVGCLKGHPQTKTPNIDRLASKGLLFTNAHCQAPLSGPSRSSIMTGLMPSTSGNYFQVKDQDIKSSNQSVAEATFMPDYFEKYGYKTMGVGKLYHNGDKAQTFDEFGGVFSMYGPTPQKRFKYDPAWFEEKVGKTQTDWGAFPEQDSMMTDYKSAAWAVSRLNEKHTKPFFLAVGFIRPHVPWYVPQKWFDMFKATDMITPPYKPDDMADVPEMGKRVADVPMMPTTEWLIKTNQWKDVVQAYLACIAFVDAQVGKVLDALEKSEYANNTIVVLWSDHGYHLGEKNRFAKQALWERDTRTVFIMKMPGSKKATECKAPVQLIDMYPTLVDLCGLPEYKLAQGHSLVPLIKNPEAKWDHYAVSIYGIGNASVRSENFRLIQYEDSSKEFYNLKEDPNEWTNQANNPKYQDQIQEMIKWIPKKWSDNSEYTIFEVNAYFKERYKKK